MPKISLDPEDRVIKSLEKKLHLKRKKGAVIPKSFKDDGLDYLLNICERPKQSKKIKNDIPESIVKKKSKKNMEDIYGRDINTVNVDCEGENFDLSPLKSKINGIFNRLSHNTLSYCFENTIELYQNNSRHSVNDTIIKVVDKTLSVQRKHDQIVLIDIAAYIILLNQKLGGDNGAIFLENFTKNFYQSYESFIENVDPKNEENLDENKYYIINICGLLAHLFNFQLMKSRLINDIIALHIKNGKHLDLEIILVMLRSCGWYLRKEDPICIKNIFLSYQSRQIELLSQASDDALYETRIKMIQDTLLALKNNNIRKIMGENVEFIQQTILSYKKTMRLVLKDCQPEKMEYDIPLQDLIECRDGKWWRVGAAYLPTTHPTTNTTDFSNIETKITNAYDIPSDKLKLLEKIAVSNGMQVKDKKEIFIILMAGHSFGKTFNNILSFIHGAKSHQSNKAKIKKLNYMRIRETFSILLHCCLTESKFNPFYSTIAIKLCQIDREYRRLCEFAIWDRINTLSEAKPSHITNLAHFIHELIMTPCYMNLIILKKMDFMNLNPTSEQFLSKLMTLLLTKQPTTSLTTQQNLADETKLSGNSAQISSVSITRLQQLFLKLYRTQPSVYESLRIFCNYIMSIGGTDKLLRENLENKNSTNDTQALMQKNWALIEGFTERMCNDTLDM